MIQNYFLKRDCQYLLAHVAATSTDDSTRRSITNLIVDFMVAAFGLKEVTAHQKKSTALATVMLFPFLRYKHSNSDGTVSYKYK